MAVDQNGTLEKGSVLFWDEPEANINPKYIPVLVESLMMLESEGFNFCFNSLIIFVEAILK